ncbi:MAG: CvpA family protein [Dehalococcoidia bacterium]|nr:CvpA family protein [Dehalococcoidia bacterium]
MNWLDIIILITLAAAVIGGLAIGIVRSIINLAGLLLGIFLAGRCYEVVGGWLKFIQNAELSNIVGFILIVIVVMIITGIAGRMLRKLLSTFLLGCFDRLLGGVVGLFIGALAWGALLALWVKFFSADTVSGSWIAKFLLDGFPLVLVLFPSSFDSVKSFFGN